MPIYEYESIHPGKGCPNCMNRFEQLQAMGEKPLEECPYCGNPVSRVISWCRAAIVEKPLESIKIERKIRNYEKQGMWSHAAELADTHAEKTKDKSTKMRALDDYKKAGYDVGTLEKHAKDDP